MDKNPKYYSFLTVLLPVGMLFSYDSEKNVKPALIPMHQQLEWISEQFNLEDRNTCFIQRIIVNIFQILLNSNEAYTLKVPLNSVILEAKIETGMFNGLQTLKQLIFVGNGKYCMKRFTITDWQAFAVRSFMQDVGWNFQSIEILKEKIDVLTAYKFNMFHFHITETLGWSFERKIYPQLNYMNHLNPLYGIIQLYFDHINGAFHGYSKRLCSILCCWNDNNVNDEYDIIIKNPIYPEILAYSETSWAGQKKDISENYLDKLTEKRSELFNKFSTFENYQNEPCDKDFLEKSFLYVNRTNIERNILEPIANNSDVYANFSVEDTLQETYRIDTTKYLWRRSYSESTIYLTHYFCYPYYFLREDGTYNVYTQIWSSKKQTVGAWIGFYDWLRLAKRRGVPFLENEEWHNIRQKAWLNGKMIVAQKWDNSGLANNTE